MQRYYTSAFLLIIGIHAFGQQGLHRVEANIQPGNTASVALVRSCGFSKEGYSPKYLKIGGRWRDHERWALVKGLHPGRASAAGRHATGERRAA